ncbi:MAG: DUF4263 domain-containing protein [Candidatus Levybacteria bacterium]|nr:DUF4263 domain-containing protein [Candidatus Levybacteria bacterium]
MPKKSYRIGELPQELKTKSVFYYVNEKQGLKVKSKEVFKNGEKVVHYPFKRDGTPKYRNIRKITYENMPENLPRGFYKEWTKGYGFTRVYNPLIYRLDDALKIQEVIVSKNIITKFENGKLYLNSDKLDSSYPKIDLLLKKHNVEIDNLANDILSKYFPQTFKNKSQKYIKGSLAQFIDKNVTQISDLSEADTQSLFDLASRISKDDFLESKTSVLKTKEKIEEVYIEEVIEEFEKLLSRKNLTKNLEERWQKFFTQYNWIFSQLFSFPVLIFKDKAYVGGKGIENANGKISDFIYKNKLTNNIAFIEIKTHKTPILIDKPYRGNDVYSVSKDMSGAVNQVLDQRDNFQKEFYSLKSKSKNKNFESYNSKCIIITGSLSKLSEEEKKSFDLMRSNSRDVDIITFDEVLEKIKGLESLLFGSKQKSTAN